MKIHRDDRGDMPVPKPYHVTMKKAALAALKLCFETERLPNYELSISFVSEKEMQELNFKYREKDTPTDVLSFPTPETAAPAGKNAAFSLGDIVICTSVAAAQAEEYGHSHERELTFLTVHGILHLLGLDHETSLNDETVMNEMQDEIMGMVFEEGGNP